MKTIFAWALMTLLLAPSARADCTLFEFPLVKPPPEVVPTNAQIVVTPQFFENDEMVILFNDEGSDSVEAEVTSIGRGFYRVVPTQALTPLAFYRVVQETPYGPLTLAEFSVSTDEDLDAPAPLEISRAHHSENNSWPFGGLGSCGGGATSHSYDFAFTGTLDDDVVYVELRYADDTFVSPAFLFIDATSFSFSFADPLRLLY